MKTKMSKSEIVKEFARGKGMKVVDVKARIGKDKESVLARRVDKRRRVTVLDMLARLEARVAIQDAIIKASGGEFGLSAFMRLPEGIDERAWAGLTQPERDTAEGIAAIADMPDPGDDYDWSVKAIDFRGPDEADEAEMIWVETKAGWSR